MMVREWYKSRSLRKEKDSPGCMSGFLHFFDFQGTHQSPTYSSQNLIPEPVFLQDMPGLEAPRNSLEICAELGEIPISEAMGEEIPIGFRLVPEATVATAAETRAESDGRKKEESSAKKRMPNLVARLMGLDLVPDYDCNSPSNRNSSASAHRKNCDDHEHHCGSSRSVSSTTTQRSFNQSQEKQLREFKTEFQVRQVLQNRNVNIPAEKRLVMVKTSHSRSLPETPRISLARMSDAADPRLSLQINKENMAFTDFNYTRGSKAYLRPDPLHLHFDLDIPFSPCSNSQRKARTGSKENKRPGDYAREIVKQAKETLNKKAGLEAGNINSNDEGVVLNANKTSSGTIWSRSNNIPRRLTKPANESGESKHSTPSSSPRLRFLSQTKPIGTHQEQTSRSPKTPPKPRSLTPPVPISRARKPKSGLQSTIKSKPNRQRFTSKLKKPNRSLDTIRTLREEPFVHVTALKITPTERCKTPLSNNLLNAVSPVVCIKKEKTTQPKILSSDFLQSPSEFYCPQCSPVKDDNETRHPTNSQFSCSLCQLYQPKSLDDRDSRVRFRYVKNILECTGIYSSSCISFTKWYSPAHPLDPDLFYRLESTQYSLQHQQLARPNRLLLFHLVDEILGDLLKPYLNMKPWAAPGQRPMSLSVSVSNSCVHSQGLLTGKQLMERLCHHISSFPSVNCQFLCDIDSIVERDFHDFSDITVSVENESIVFEIEREITETLLYETALQLL